MTHQYCLDAVIPTSLPNDPPKRTLRLCDRLHILVCLYAGALRHLGLVEKTDYLLNGKALACRRALGVQTDADALLAEAAEPMMHGNDWETIGYDFEKLAASPRTECEALGIEAFVFPNKDHTDGGRYLGAEERPEGAIPEFAVIDWEHAGNLFDCIVEAIRDVVILDEATHFAIETYLFNGVRSYREWADWWTRRRVETGSWDSAAKVKFIAEVGTQLNGWCTDCLHRIDEVRVAAKIEAERELTLERDREQVDRSKKELPGRSVGKAGEAERLRAVAAALREWGKFKGSDSPEARAAALTAMKLAIDALPLIHRVRSVYHIGMWAAQAIDKVLYRAEPDAKRDRLDPGACREAWEFLTSSQYPSDKPLPDELEVLADKWEGAAGVGGTTAAASAAGEEAHRFQRDGETWRIVFNGKVLPSFKDRIGFWHIATLLRHPQKRMTYAEVAGDSRLARGEGASRKNTLAFEDREQLGTGSGSSSDAAYDDQGLAAARKKIKDLKEGIEEANKRRDETMAGVYKDELADILAQMGRDKGLEGRARTLGAEAETTRKRVCQAVIAAIAAIKEVDVDAGDYFDTTIVRKDGLTYTDSISWSL